MDISIIIIGGLAWLLAICLITIFMISRRQRFECVCTYWEDFPLCDDCEDCD